MTHQSLINDLFDEIEKIKDVHPDYYKKLKNYYEEVTKNLNQIGLQNNTVDSIYNSDRKKRNYFTITSKESFNNLTNSSNSIESLIYTPLNDHSRKEMAKGDVVFCYRQGQFNSLHDALDIRGIYGIGIVASDPELLFPSREKHNKYGVLVLFPVLLNESLELRNIQMHPVTIDLTPYNGNRNDALQYIDKKEHYLTLLNLIYSKNIEQRECLSSLLPEVNFNVVQLPNDILTKTYSDNTTIKASNHSYLASEFVSWFYKETNYKPSYGKLLSTELLIFWNNSFFNNELFVIDAENIDISINKIKELIKNASVSWKEYSDGTSRGVPNAILGPNNYIKFLQEFFGNSENITKYIAFTNDERPKTKNYNSLSLPKPFLLLAGISGTGKSRFVRKQAENTNNGKENFELVSVRPDWHEPSDLLGYVSRLSSDGPQYVATPVLSFMVKAWLDIVESADKSGWQAKDHDQISPFWLCLDEMNLAPVEQYFADYLSVIETRKWENGEYSCEPLLKKDIFEQLGDKAKDKLQKELGLENHPELWQYFLAHGIAIPFNLIVAGTVNMDETTHGFSRKVIDRALTFDFGEFFPNHLEDFFDATQEPKLLSYPIYSKAKLELFSEVPADLTAEKTKAFFNTINTVLSGTPFELAFRAFNELCLTVISFAPKTQPELEAVFDDFLMCKVLPRIEGDDDKLLSHTGENLLQALTKLLETELAEIWESERPDLLRKHLSSDDVITIPCRTKKKLAQMEQLLTRGFSSFWP